MEKEPLIAIHFSFGCHTAEDIEQFENIRQQAEHFFSPQDEVSNIYLCEAVNGTPQLSRKIDRLYKTTGSYVATLVSIARGYPANASDIRKFLEYVNNTPLKNLFYLNIMNMLCSISSEKPVILNYI